MTESEDEALIERLARAAYEADDNAPSSPPASWNGWHRREVRRFLAMQRELERARCEAEDDDFDTEALKSAVKSLPTKDTDQ